MVYANEYESNDFEKRLIIRVHNSDKSMSECVSYIARHINNDVIHIVSYTLFICGLATCMCQSGN